jgi:hypothetical protein
MEIMGVENNKAPKNKRFSRLRKTLSRREIMHRR